MFAFLAVGLVLSVRMVRVPSFSILSTCVMALISALYFLLKASGVFPMAVVVIHSFLSIIGFVH